MAVYGDAFSVHGMKVNMALGKTNCIFVWHGHGSATVERRVMYDQGVIVECIVGMSTYLLPVVTSYKHLGSMTRGTASVCQEIVVKAAAQNTCGEASQEEGGFGGRPPNDWRAQSLPPPYVGLI